MRCEDAVNPTRTGAGLTSLAPQPYFPTLRNLARRKLADLPYARWQSLVGDLVSELDRRYPAQGSTADIVEQLGIDSPDSRESSDVVQSVNDETPEDQRAGVDHIELEKVYHCKGCEEVSCLSLLDLEAYS
jgi:hypothetical protein